jgi:hypothetical protein
VFILIGATKILTSLAPPTVNSALNPRKFITFYSENKELQKNKNKIDEGELIFF